MTNLRGGGELGPVLVLGDVVEKRIVLHRLIRNHREP